MQIDIHDHPLLRVAAFTTRFPAPLAELPADPHGAAALLVVGENPATAAVPVSRDEDLRQAVRDMLRVGGYKPTGRGKPASEYLVRAVESGELGPINAAVDACNAVSYRSGFPISVVDAALIGEPLRIDIAPPGATYVFNRAGHEIDLTGLVCLFDTAGPCANAVKDAQRTKTTGETLETLSVVWGVAGFEDRLLETAAWYRQLLESTGATTRVVL